MKKIYKIVIIISLFIIPASCYMPTNPTNTLSPIPYLQTFGAGDKQYIIYTKGQMLWALNALSVSGAAEGIRLVADIDFGSGLGEERTLTKIEGINNFSAVFDGNGHTISGFYIDKLGVDNVGFIGELSGAGVVKNLTIDNDVVISGGNGVGAVVGKNNGGRVENCNNNGSVNALDDTGGVVGNNNGVVKNSHNTGAVSGEEKTGGVVGLNDLSGSVENCYNTGSVDSRHPFVGGVVGNNNGVVKNSHNTGAVSGEEKTGGVVGLNDLSGSIENCYNTGSVRSLHPFVGGIAGQNELGGTIRNCYNTANVNGGQNVGGIVGLNYGGPVSDCYNIGNVEGLAGGSDIGGVIGTDSGGLVDANYFLKTAAVNDALFGIGSSSLDTGASPITSISDFGLQHIFTGWFLPGSPWKMKSGLGGNVGTRPVLNGVGYEGI